ncbi:hypothetical protein PAT3040_05814 [Paenibacillus agaridevorans]|uniref:Glycoside hydrolase family 38 central domain-containing protein n=2 Tax=Paenibacillus agaridevorans TaxID=171404 RepID=A0A2R5EY41_9BACL|nr:hypothetical protein PAT3040_05814 [Paenibacillus agaridevorans]
MMNELIDVMEDTPDFQTFHLDGQTVVLEDFMEIEPGKRERLGRLIQEGRIVIGPWYVMPDEFLVSGESIIRNLLKGRQICREWGVEPWKYGYICDTFGHIAQLPQIFKGFGIPYSILGRGLNEHSVPSHFRWASPDGSECIAYKLFDDNSYGAFLVVLLRADARKSNEDETKTAIREHVERELSRSPYGIGLLMDSQDHARIRPDTGIYLDIIQELFPEADVKHVNLEEMGQQLEAYRDVMPVRSGELYEPGKNPGSNYVIPHTLSSRYPLKQANDICQALLEKWVEPLVAIATLRGFHTSQSYVDMAYQYLLLNHPHDSICGCSIDAVHEDMKYRYNQSKEISLQVVGSILDKELERFGNTDGGSGGNLVLLLRNPLVFPQRLVVTVDIDFEPQYPCQFQEPFGYEQKNSFLIFDHQGHEIPYGLVKIRRNYKTFVQNKIEKVVDRHTVSLMVDLPAMGTAEYKVVPSSQPSRYLERMSRNRGEAENEYLKLTVQDNGTIRITDKRTGRVYDNLCSYLDDGEIGDGWFHVCPVEDRMIDSHGFECAIETIENGPSRTVFQVSQTVRLPRELIQNNQSLQRSNDVVPVLIRTRIGLSQGAAYVDVETTVDNQARDHRFRLVIPTGVTESSYFVNQAFAFVRRPTGFRLETQNWKESDAAEKQTGGIVGKRRDDGTGLAFISPFGLHECAAPDNEQGEVHVTLFRSFQKTYLTNGEEGGQLIGQLSFKYALAPLTADVSDADLARLQDCLQAGVRHATVKIDAAYNLSAPASHFELSSSDIQLSIMKRPENGRHNELIVRCVNLSDKPETAWLRSFMTIGEVMKATLHEEALEPVSHERDGFLIKLAAWQIQTYRLTLA